MKCETCSNEAVIVMKSLISNREVNFCVHCAISGILSQNYKLVRKIDALKFNEIELPEERLEILNG